MSARTHRVWQSVFGAVAVLSLVAALLARAPLGREPGAAKARVANGKAVTDPPFERKDLSALTAAEVTALRNGVLAMMRLDCKAGHTAPACEQEVDGVKPDANLSPLGWKYQAAIHGSLPDAVDQTAWDTCQHATWFFLSWHRMELYFFERILRKASGSATLTLPYWNFGAQPKLPAPFRMEMVNGAANALWWNFRNPKLNVNDQPLCPSVIATSRAFAQTAFFTNILGRGPMSFGGGASQIRKHLEGGGFGQIEMTPHNAVHLTVGRADLPDTDRRNFLSMANPVGAGLDPIFWPVHANIDRAWSRWQVDHPGSEPKSDAWLNTVKFTFFDVQDAAPGYKEVTMSGKDVINTAAQLSYTYDNLSSGFQVPTPVPMIEAPGPLASSSTNNGSASQLLNTALTARAESHAILAAEPVTVSIHLSSEIQKRIEAAIQPGAPAGSILLTIAGIAADEPTGAWYQIYLNLPRGVVPDDQSAYFVDNLSLFGIGHHPHEATSHDHAASEGNTVTYDVTDAVRQLAANRGWQQDQVSITFLNTAADAADCASPPGTPDSARLRFTSVTLTVK